MNASKETAKSARNDLWRAAELLDLHMLDVASKQAIKAHLLRADAFVEAAERWLPTEASFERDRQRRKAKATAASGLATRREQMAAE